MKPATPPCGAGRLVEEQILAKDAGDFADPVHGRRAIFRLGLKRVVEPLVDYLENRFDLSMPAERTWLRPPGAMPENAFLETCYRCGNCIDVCPAHAIRATASDDPQLSGTPSIDPDVAACVVCEELACMKTCPSGALEPLDAPRDIRMGLAEVDLPSCLRTHGEECTLCVDRCPMGAEAIGFGDSGQVEVDPDGCVGCGVCQHVCPSLPKAIRVLPR
jgi:ferredoxin-type protein NapG